MNTRIMICATALLILGCQSSDHSVQQDLTGEWDVRVSLSKKTGRKLDQDMHQADKDIQDAKTEIRSELDSAGKEIRKALDENGITITTDDGHSGSGKDMAEGLEQLVEGLGQMAEGIANMGIGLGTAITRAITDHLKLAITLQPDGTIQAASRNGKIDIDINNNDQRWKVENGKFILYGDGTPDIFDIQTTESGFDLKGEEFILHLQRPGK